LEGTGSGNVSIEVKNHDLDEVMVTIEDDGIGISQVYIDNIHAGTTKGNKIGMSNVDARLRHIYGTGLKIERPSVGTKISFILNKNTSY